MATQDLVAPEDALRRAVLVRFGALTLGLLVAGALVAALLAFSGAPSPERLTATVDPAVYAGWETCANSEEGYRISYPGGWYEDGSCGAFDPAPVMLVEGSDCCPTAFFLFAAHEPVEAIVASLTEPLFVHVLAHEEVMVGDLRAVVLETEATGAGLYDEGTMSYAYVIDRDGEAFVVETVGLAADGYAENREIVDAAVRTLEFSGTQR
jgi:hypothetical protein